MIIHIKESHEYGRLFAEIEFDKLVACCEEFKLLYYNPESFAYTEDYGVRTNPELLSIEGFTEKDLALNVQIGNFHDKGSHTCFFKFCPFCGEKFVFQYKLKGLELFS